MDVRPNPLQIALRTWPGALPPCTHTSPHIPAHILQQHSTAADVLASAHAHAAELEQAAAAALAQATAAAADIRQQAHAQVQEELQQLRQATQQQAFGDTVQWLCEEQALEQTIARQLSLRWRHLTAQVLEQMVGEFDQTALLVRRLERQVSALLPHGQLSLHVAPAAADAARQAFAQIPQVQVVVDTQLACAQARLESTLVRVHLDGPAQIDALLAQLSGDEAKVAYA